MPNQPVPLRLLQNLSTQEINKSLREIADALGRVEAQTGTVNAVFVALEAPYTLTSSYADVPGLSVTIPSAGTWLVRLVAYFSITVSAIPQVQLLVSRSAQTPAPTLDTSLTGTSIPMTAEWQITTQGPNVLVRIQIKDASGVGTADLITAGTSLSALALSA